MNKIVHWTSTATITTVLVSNLIAPSALHEPSESKHFTVPDAFSFSQKVENTLLAQHAKVAILARMGRPPSELPEGMHFTHVAFAVLENGRYVIHNLYQETAHPDVSDLVNGYSADFFADVAELEAGVLIPSPELQSRILSIIESKTYEQLHDSHYSVIANPFKLDRQNCTGFVLDVTNAAIYGTTNINTIKDIERKYFDAQRVNVSALKLVMAGLFTTEVSTVDQSFNDAYTATYETIAKYVQRHDKNAVQLVITK